MRVMPTGGRRSLGAEIDADRLVIIKFTNQ